MENEGEDDREDLEDYDTAMSRLVARSRGWLALFVAVLLVVPLGGWLLEELAFQRSGDEVGGELGAGDLADSVFLVRTGRCDGTSGSGSGFVTRRDGEAVVVTNRHVVEDGRVIGLRRITGGPALEVTAYRLSDTADVAVLEVADPAELPAALPFGDPVDEGAPVRIVGFPAARPFTTSGAVERADPGRLLVDVRTDPGASGSPLVDSDGRVVGQVFARSEEGFGVATPVGALSEAIASARAVEPGC